MGAIGEPAALRRKVQHAAGGEHRRGCRHCAFPAMRSRSRRISTPSGSVRSEGGFDAELFNSRARFRAHGLREKDHRASAAALPSRLYGIRPLRSSTAGTLRTRGIEVALEALPIQTQRMQWTSRITFSSDESEITELPVPPFSGGGFRHRAGRVPDRGREVAHPDRRSRTPWPSRTIPAVWRRWTWSAALGSAPSERGS